MDRLARGAYAGGRRRAARMANGAGIAADPTLTGVWMTFPLPMPPANLRPLPLQGHAWRPMSSLSLPCLAAGLARDLSPALAPASGFRSGWLSRPSSGLSLPTFAAAPSLPPRPRPFTFRQLPRLGAYAVSAAPAFGPGSWPVRCHRVAPTLELSRLAFGRSLLHAHSRSARGQMSPPPSG